MFCKYISQNVQSAVQMNENAEINSQQMHLTQSSIDCYMQFYYTYLIMLDSHGQ